MGRDEIKSGDMLVWSTDKYSLFSRIFLKIVRIFTSSEYAHVAIVWRIDGKLFIVEATPPYVRLIPVKDSDEFYHIPAKLEWNQNCESFLIDKLGKPYSFMDDLRAYFNMSIDSNDRWQCAELANRFYFSQGIDLGKKNNTPTRMVSSLIVACDSYIRKFNAISGT